ncbi:MAG TPA: hypothetical protein VKJ83_02085, partial [Actinomycetota bacterium]|nr:hypothetical protein [Actinomycetota bacterium]
MAAAGAVPPDVAAAREADPTGAAFAAATTLGVVPAGEVDVPLRDGAGADDGDPARPGEPVADPAGLAATGPGVAVPDTPAGVVAVPGADGAVAPGDADRNPEESSDTRV